MNTTKMVAYVFCALQIFSYQAAQAEPVSIKGSTVNLRSGPDTTFDVICQYGNGFPVDILERKNGWIKVIDFEDETGWIADSLISDEQHVIIKTSKGRRSRVNIREQPSRKSHAIGQGYYGVVFKKVSEKNGWTEVEHESGVHGWVKNDFLWGL